MQNTLKTRVSQVFLLGILLSFAIGLNYLHAWTAPAQAPTDGNVDAPLNTGGTLQGKSGGLTLGSTLDIGSSLTVGGVTSDGPYLIDMGSSTPGAFGGIRFPDDTVQTTAPTGGIGSVEIVGYVCQGGPDCSVACSSYGQNPTCNTQICPAGTTLQSHDQIDSWTDSGCTNIGSGGQCQGPWSRSYSRVVGLCS